MSRRKPQAVQGRLRMPRAPGIGDQVIVVGGVHHLRHGQVVEPYPSTGKHPPAGFVVVRFRTKRGLLAYGRTHAGIPLDMLPVTRLAVWEATDA